MKKMKMNVRRKHKNKNYTGFVGLLNMANVDYDYRLTGAFKFHKVGW
jgi:hypothetical protein